MERYLFHHPSFIFRHTEDSIIPFKSERVSIYFSRLGSSLLSLDKAPFGSFILETGATAYDIVSVIEKIEAWSKANAIGNLYIRCFPEIYSLTQSSLIKNALVESGFTIKYKDVTQVIPVSTGVEMNLNTHKKRRLRKAQMIGFEFRPLSVDFLEESYSLFVESRENKGYPITMSLEEIKNMFALFPKDYLLFGVFDKRKMIAASVSIKINTRILYCFYIGDLLSYRAFSPATILVCGLHHFCSLNQVDFLDLGISTDKGVLNQGLYSFKKSFGSFDSHKLTFEKKL